jgi:hypothetical protein
MKKRELSFSREIDRDVYTDMPKPQDAEKAVMRLMIKFCTPPLTELEKKVFQDHGYIV